ncbi:uncharacterized protein [Pyrus communis]|uniref:uncharacterized protein n=1 Tax=Pyrus communis TaxID=23211 RepID=UPI0035C12629
MENAIVKGWLINSMEPNLIRYCLRLLTTKEVWDAIAHTYYDGSDISQVYDLTCKASRMRQDGRPGETYYNDLQSLWQEIDYHRPNLMKCGLDEMFDKIRSDILRIEPLSSVEQTFAYVHREGMRQAVMNTGGQLLSGATMVARPATRALQKQRERDEQAKLGQANLATFMSQLSLISQNDPPPVSSSSNMSPESSGNCGYVFNMNSDATPSGWIIDSGATDHMTYDPIDLASDTIPLRRNITNANGVTLPDILTKEIIGHGTKRGNLYFVDDVSTGRVTLTQGAVDHKRRSIWHNYGKPPNRYSPDTTKSSKYPIANYVSSQKLSEPGKAFVQQISNDSTPSSLKNALSDDRWTKAMEEEMAALQKNQTDGTKPCPSPFLLDRSMNPTFEVWNENDQNLPIWFNSTISKEIVDYLQQIKEISDSLTAVGAAISDRDLIAAMSAHYTSKLSPSWLIDSSTISHITNDISNIESHVHYHGEEKVYIEDVYSVFVEFKCYAENILGNKIKVVQSNSESEFTSNIFKSFLKSHGIMKEFSCPHTPKENGSVERKHRHLVETAITLLLASQVSYLYWVEAFSTAVYLINRLPIGGLLESSWELL